MNTKTKEKRNVYKEITTSIILNLSAGEIPWHKRWCTPMNGKINYKSRRSYSGINLIYLQQPGEYLTFKQCEELGGHVNKGEHGHTVYQYFSFVPTRNKEEYERLKKEGKDTDHLLLWDLKFLKVFHLSQTTGIPTKIETVEHEQARKPVDMADYIIEEYKMKTGAIISETTSDYAGYDRSDNTVRIPSRTQFRTEEQFYNTLFGELAKCALQKSRDTEPDGGRKENTVKDELICEIAASMIMSGVGLDIPETKEDTLAACSRWMDAMNKDFRLIVTASNHAQKIAETMLAPLM